MNAELLARSTFEEVDDWYRQGRLSQDDYEAYRHAWAIHPSHDGYSLAHGWDRADDFSAEVQARAQEILSAT